MASKVGQGIPAVAATGAQNSPPPPSRIQQVTQGVGNGLSSLASYVPVKSVRNTRFWSVVSWPFSVIGSLFSGIWSRISNRIWGAPRVITREVTVEFPGYLWNSTVTTTTERAIRKGWLTIEQGIANGDFTLDEAQINGWVPVTFKGYLWNSTMMLKTAIETGKMTVEEAIAAGHFTAAQAAKADWLQKK